MANVLITGATGFVGGHLAEALVARGNRVRCLVRSTSATALLEQAQVEIVRAGLDDGDAVHRALHGIDAVYHVAGALAERRPGELHRVNAQLTSNLALACASRESPPTFVLVSSVAAAGPTRRGEVRQPADPPNPISQYGRSKYEGEKHVAAHAANMPVTIVRPGVVLGERDRASLAIFKTIRYWRFHPVLGLRTPPLSVIHVADLVELLIRAARQGRRVSPEPDSSEPGRGCYFACLDQYPTYAELGRMVRREINRPFAPVLPIPKPAAMAVAATNQGMARLGLGIPLLSLDKVAEAAAASWACSPSETFRDLEFTPTVSLQERLRQTAAWYREAKWL